jgi:hypothetical protein
MLSLTNAGHGQTRPDQLQSAAFAHTFAVPKREFLRNGFRRHGFGQVERASSHGVMHNLLTEERLFAILTQYIDE